MAAVAVWENIQNKVVSRQTLENKSVNHCLSSNIWKGVLTFLLVRYVQWCTLFADEEVGNEPKIKSLSIFVCKYMFFVVFGFKKNHIHKNSPQSLMNELQCGKSKRHLEVFLVMSVEVVLSLNLWFQGLVVVYARVLNLSYSVLFSIALSLISESAHCYMLS